MSTAKDNQKFNLKQFNADFEEDLKKKNEDRAKKEEVELDKLNAVIVAKPVIEMNIAELLIGIKDTWFGLMDDLLLLKFNIDTFTKNNRLFFIGITIVLIVIFMYTIHYLDNIGENGNKHEKIIKIYHINETKS